MRKSAKLDRETEDRVRRYKKLAALLRRWMNEPGDYDERVATALEGLGDRPVRLREPMRLLLDSNRK